MSIASQAVGSFAVAAPPTDSGSVHNLLADNVESASNVSNPGVGQTHVLTSVDSESTSEVSSPVLVDIGAVNVLNADNVETTTELTIPVIGQVHILNTVSAESLSQVSNPALSDGTEQEGQNGGGYFDGLQPVNPPTEEEVKKQREQLGIIKPDKPKKPRKTAKRIGNVKLAQKPEDYQYIKKQIDIQAEKEFLKSLKEKQQETDKDILIKIQIALNALEARAAQIEEQDVVFMITLLAS